MQIEKGMYGLPQASILANKVLPECLAKRGYFELPYTRGLWTHVHRPVWFTLIADDFGVTFVGKEHAQHLLNALSYYKDADMFEKGNLCKTTANNKLPFTAFHLKM